MIDRPALGRYDHTQPIRAAIQIGTAHRRNPSSNCSLYPILMESVTVTVHLFPSALIAHILTEVIDI